MYGKTHWTSHNEKIDLRTKKYIIENLGFDEVLDRWTKSVATCRMRITDDWKKENVFDIYRKDMEMRYEAKKKILHGRQDLRCYQIISIQIYG